MSINQAPNKLKITAALAIDLIAEQFPQWAHLPIRPVALSGMDNTTFRLGDDMSIRLPTAKAYALQVEKEQKWLPILAPHLSLHIPEPLAIGKPSKHYPWQWSVYRWIFGECVSTLRIEDLDLPLLSEHLAQFLNELHKIDIADGPLPGLHNYWRGDHPSVYDAGTRAAIIELQDFIDTKAVTSVWEEAIKSTWHKHPVWVHGDLSADNMLVKDNQLTAVIDFGCMGIGDPACDLVIAWTFLTNESRKIFKSHLDLDSNTWVRARGWALWKALITLAPLKDKTSVEAMKQQKIIHEILQKRGTA